MVAFGRHSLILESPSHCKFCWLLYWIFLFVSLLLFSSSPLPSLSLTPIFCTMPRHFSNLPSSACEGDTSDPFYSCFPNNSQLYTPEPSGSQEALVANSDFSQTLLSPPPIPNFLQHVGPDRHKGYVLYTHEYN